MPDLLGGVVGWLSIVVMLYVFKNCESLSNGNVGDDE